MLYIPFEEILTTLRRALEKAGFDGERAARLADVFARNSLEGVYSHGVNRFPRFLKNVREGTVDRDARPERVAGLGGMEVWDGHFGAGPLIAEDAMARAIELSRAHGIACVAVRHGNHWMRAGRYGWQAARAGVAGILFTNTTANMPAWGAVDAHLGNNPIVLAIPREKGPVVVDMAMSQFAYGKLEVAALSGEELPIDGGFDEAGNLTRDPQAILRRGRMLPTVYWKGSAMSVALDLMAGALWMGRTVSAISADPSDERGLSQVFIAVNFRGLLPGDEVDALLDAAIADIQSSTPAPGGAPVRYPGQNMERTIERNRAQGVPINEETWRKIEDFLRA